MRLSWQNSMHRDPLQTLVHLVATEPNPHELILRVTADSRLLKEMQRLCRKLPDAAGGDGHIEESCKSSQISRGYFMERLQMIARIINLLPYEQNYYEILDLGRSASPQEIRHAYRRLSFSCHPDTNPNDSSAAKRFRNIQHAYEVLSNAALRQSYDLNLTEQAWNDEAASDTATLGPSWRERWRGMWPFGLFFVLLLVTTLVVDYRQSRTQYFSAGSPAFVGTPASSSPLPWLGVKGADMETADQSIHEFLSRFAKAYEARDPAAFLPYFEAEALANDRPVKELIPFYEASFQRAKDLRYRIEVRRWEVRGDEVMVDGSFSLIIQIGLEAPVKSTGPIQIILSRRGADFGVKRLNYSIRESRKTLE